MLNAGGLDYHPADWTRGRLARLAEGDGVGPARQHAGRDRPGAERRRGRQEADGDAVPAVPLRRARSDPQPGRRRRRGLRAGRRDRRHPQPAAPAVRPQGAGRAVHGPGGPQPDARPGSARATAWAATPGWSTASTPPPARRCSPTTRTSASRCRACGCRWACTAATSPTRARSTSPGFSFSGVPGVIIGHNADIAWGFTNLGPDVTDLYVERVSGDTWRYGGRAQPLRTRTETIEVADGKDVRLTVRSTDHGPIVSDVDDVLADVALDAKVPRPDRRGRSTPCRWRWTALEPRPDGRRHPRAQPGGGLGRLPGRPRRLRGALAERRLRRPRGPHRLPGTRADPDPQVGERRLDPRRGLAPGERLDG